jgi:ethanolamine utilization protein EutA
VVHAGLDLLGTFDPAALTAAIENSLDRMDLSPDARLAIAFAWHGDPDYARIAAAGRAIAAAVAPAGRRDEPLLLMIDGDVGKTFGQFLRDELDLAGHLVSIDGVQLQELDFVDVGALISPPGVVPVVIKSLLFS